MGHCSLTEKSPQMPKKMSFFEFSFAVAQLLIETKLFCFYKNFIFTTVLISPKDINFRQKKIDQGRKYDFFFGFFSSVEHLPIKTKLFVFNKFSYLQRFRDFIWGGAEKALQTNKHTNNKQTNEHHERS